MKGSEHRDRERKREILKLFNPRENGHFLYRNRPRKSETLEPCPRPSKARILTPDEIAALEKGSV